MQINNSNPALNFGIKLGGIDKLTNHYRDRDFDKIKIYAKALKKVGDDDTILAFGVGKYNERFGDLRTRISNKKFGDEVLLEKEEIRNLNPFNALNHALASNFGFVGDACSIKPREYSDFSLEKVKIIAGLMEKRYLENIAEKHNLKPTEVLKKYNVEDGHWKGIADYIERNQSFKLDSNTPSFRPDYGNKDQIKWRNDAYQELLDIIG